MHLYSNLEFEFVTPGDDGTISTGTLSSPLYQKFAVNAVGSPLSINPESRKNYIVVFYYNRATRELKLGHSDTKPELHFRGIFGIKNFN